MEVKFTLSEKDADGFRDVTSEYPEGTTVLDMLRVNEEILFGLRANNVPKEAISGLLDAIYADEAEELVEGE